MEPCPLHEELSGDIKMLLRIAAENRTHIEEIFRSITELKVSIGSHISEAEKEGGIRDRVRRAEEQVGVIKKGYWKTGLTCGFIGALLGHITPDFGRIIVIFLKAHMGA